MVAATYGFVSAFGQNIALIPTLTTGMKWFPNRKGIIKTHNVMYDILEMYYNLIFYVILTDQWDYLIIYF